MCTLHKCSVRGLSPPPGPSALYQVRRSRFFRRVSWCGGDSSYPMEESQSPPQGARVSVSPWGRRLPEAAFSCFDVFPHQPYPGFGGEPRRLPHSRGSAYVPASLSLELPDSCSGQKSWCPLGCAGPVERKGAQRVPDSCGGL